MASHVRVINLTRGFRLKFNQAEKSVEACAAAWVEYGVSLRDLTLAEAIAARNAQAKLREPMPFAEIHGLQVAGIINIHEELELAAQANHFFEQAIAS